MLSTAHAKPQSDRQVLLDQGFLSTRSTLENALTYASPIKPDGDKERVLLVDVCELYIRLRTSDEFKLLRTFIPEVFLFDTCHDYDNFYHLLADMKNNTELAGDDLVLDDKTYDELEYQGSRFVDLYLNGFIMPEVNRVAGQKTYMVHGMTISQQVVITY